jgi:D-sedoheptulose 7-phosphate isomerase
VNSLSFSQQFLEEVCEIAEKIDTKVIDEVIYELVKLRERGGRLFILGVGGSAANASHAVNDFRKLTNIETYAPTDNVSELTARTNDEGWNSFFARWLEVSHLNSNDCIFIFSVGGGNRELNISAGICDAVDLALARNVLVMGIVGREEGYVQTKASRCLVVPPLFPERVTPHSEAFQAVVWHLIVSHPSLNQTKTKW